MVVDVINLKNEWKQRDQPGINWFEWKKTTFKQDWDEKKKKSEVEDDFTETDEVKL